MKTESVSILLEAIPYIRRFSGSIIVIKFGGSAMIDEELRKNFALDLVLLQYVGIKPVVVHGGGPQINTMLQNLSIQSKFVDGHRITNEASMEVVEMILSGKINKDIVSLINKEGGSAVGISGRDGLLARAKLHSLTRLDQKGEKETITLGRVGKVEAKDISPRVLRTLENDGYMPVIAPVAMDEEGYALNVNADTMAGAVATALRSQKLILLTDTQGVLVEDQVMPYLSPQEIPLLIEEKKIQGGMIPKVECCINAVNTGVSQAHIIDGRVSHSLLLEIFTERGVGTLISYNPR